MVTVFLAKALICFAGVCHPVLVGRQTPTGTFQLQHVLTTSRGYGGDIIIFKQSEKYVWAIHRVWRGNPKQHRVARLQSNDPKDRVITMGCLNVMPDVYEGLVKCCSTDKLQVLP